MAKYKIKVIQHLLKGNKTAKSGEIVDGSQFINLQASLDGNYIEEFEEKKDKQVDTDNGLTPLAVELKKVKKLSKDELIAYAKDHEIDVDTELSKKDLLIDVVAELEEKFSKASE
jgi:hypothetical protein